MSSYLDQMVTHDATDLLARGDAQKMRAYFDTLSLNTAGSPNDLTLYAVAGINSKAAARYDGVFEDLSIAEKVPPRFSNRIERIEKAKKRYVLDPGLAASAGNLDAASVMGDHDLLGRMLDTFILAQLRPEVAFSDPPVRIHHLRTNAGRQEVDILAELSGNRVIGLEVTASAAVDRSDAKHLVWLRNELGPKFVPGAVMHTGPDIFEVSERVFAVPISSIWASR